jgi:archaellum component FlaD/FlaE
MKATASLFPNDVDSYESSGDEAYAAKRTADLIRSNLAQQSPFPSLPFPTVAKNVPDITRRPSETEGSAYKTDLAGDEAEAEVENENEDEDDGEDDEDEDEDEGEDDNDDEEEIDDDNSKAAEKLEVATSKSPTSKNVPRSMAEIYRLSNQNRKRNKEKKKLKEDATTHPSSPVVLVDDSEGEPETSIIRSKRQKGTHKKDPPVILNENIELPPVAGDTMEFMKEIGWIPNSDKTSSGGDVKSSTPHQGKHSLSANIPIPTSAVPLPGNDYSLSPPKTKQNKKRQPSPRGQGGPPSRPHHPQHSNAHTTYQQQQHFKPPSGFVAFDYSNTSFSANQSQTAQPATSAYYNPYVSSSNHPQRAPRPPNNSAHATRKAGGQKPPNAPRHWK